MAAEARAGLTPRTNAGASSDAHPARDLEQHAVVRLGRGVELVGAAKVAAVQHARARRRCRGSRPAPARRHEPDVARACRRRAPRRGAAPAGSSGSRHGQQQGGRVGQPQRRHRERQRRSAELAGDGDGHRGQQDRGRVEAEDDGAARQRGRRRAATARRPVPPRPGRRGGQRRRRRPARSADLGDEGDGDEEDEDRRDALDEVGEVEVSRQGLGVAASSQGRPARGGGVSSTSKRSDNLSASACGVRGASACTSCAGHEATGVLGHVRRAGDRDVHPALGALALGRHTRRHTCSTGSRRRAPRLGDRGQRRGQRLAPDRASGPTPGRLTADVDAVGRHRSPRRSAPKRAETTTIQRLARRLAAASSEARSRAS